MEFCSVFALIHTQAGTSISENLEDQIYDLTERNRNYPARAKAEIADHFEVQFSVFLQRMAIVFSFQPNTSNSNPNTQTSNPNTQTFCYKPKSTCKTPNSKP
jgi:hypothetical protein